MRPLDHKAIGFLSFCRAISSSRSFGFLGASISGGLDRDLVLLLHFVEALGDFSFRASHFIFICNTSHIVMRGAFHDGSSWVVRLFALVIAGTFSAEVIVAPECTSVDTNIDGECPLAVIANETTVCVDVLAKFCRPLLLYHRKAHQMVLGAIHFHVKRFARHLGKPLLSVDIDHVKSVRFSSRLWWWFLDLFFWWLNLFLFSGLYISDLFIGSFFVIGLFVSRFGVVSSLVVTSLFVIGFCVSGGLFVSGLIGGGLFVSGLIGGGLFVSGLRVGCLFGIGLLVTRLFIGGLVSFGLFVSGLHVGCLFGIGLLVTRLFIGDLVSFGLFVSRLCVRRLFGIGLFGISIGFFFREPFDIIFDDTDFLQIRVFFFFLDYFVFLV